MQLDIYANRSLEQHYRLVVLLENDLYAILPSAESRYTGVREKLLATIGYCKKRLAKTHLPMLCTQTRFCKLQDHITAAAFGCESGYFDRHLKDQPLKVICELGGWLKVQSPDEESWDLRFDQIVMLPLGEEAAA